MQWVITAYSLMLAAFTITGGRLGDLFGRKRMFVTGAIIFAIGMTGLLLYNFGLSNAHPIIISVILNLSPFWAAAVAYFLSRVPIPVSPAIFFGCFAGAFLGAMAVAWSQLGDAGKPTMGQLA